MSSSYVHPSIGIADVLGKWKVHSIQFTDCPDEKSSSLNMLSPFTSEDNVVLYVSMEIEFDLYGHVRQIFRTYEDGELTEYKEENSRYTLGDNMITICDLEGTSCECSLISLQQDTLIIKGRDVTNKCYVLLESTK